MLKMKLPMKSAVEGGHRTAEDELEETSECNLHIPGSSFQSSTNTNRFTDSPSGLRYPASLDKEAVYEWFGLYLSPAKRIEFMCGLLHMCQPPELRFLGSYLEDLARKDFHILRDSEIKANGPNDLRLLTDITDPVIRSKLLVCMSLLGSENRECAEILFRILSHVDSSVNFFKNCGLPVTSYTDHHRCGDGEEPGGSLQGCGPPMEVAADAQQQLELLLTMASLHPAFPFHQRESLRMHLDKIERSFEEERQHYHHNNTQQNNVQPNDYFAPSTDNNWFERTAPTQGNQTASRKAQREAVHIEMIMLKGVSRSRTDRCLEYTFEVNWSDLSLSSVTKTHQELEDFLLKLPKELSTESFERDILRLLSQGHKWEHGDLEQTLRDTFLIAPQAFLQRDRVCLFFLSNSTDLGHSHNMEPHMASHRKKYADKSPSLSILGNKGPQMEERRAKHLEHNGVLDWKKKSCSLNPNPEHCTPASDEHLSEDKWSLHPGSKKKMKSVTDREKGRKGDSRISYITNGILRPAPVHLVRSESGKDPRLDAGSGPDTCGGTSSEGYSSPSSPKLDGRESFESQDEKDKDTDSNSEDSGNAMGAASAEGRSVAPAVFLKDDALRPESPLSSSKFTQLSFMPPIQCVIQNGAPKPEGVVPSQTVDSKPVGLMVTVPTALPSMREAMVSPAAAGDTEKQHLDTISLLSALNPSQPQQPGSPAIYPLIQRFKMSAPPISQSSENFNTTQHQSLVGAINLISPNPAYMSTLKSARGYPSGEPMGPGLPPAMPHTESLQAHNKPPPLSLPTGMPAPLPSFGLPVSRPSPGAAGTPPPARPQAVGQVQAMVPPAVPTHTPGPAPSPNLALTHSTAQTNSTSYIDSSVSSAGPHQPPPPPPQQQQQPPPSAQQLGCGACGCRGSCGSNHSPSFYFTPHRQLFSVQPLFHLTSLCNSSYLNQAHQSNGATQLPFFPPAHSPYPNGPLLHAHTDHMLGNQANYGLQQMTAFGRFYVPPMYQTVSMMPNTANGAGVKKNGSISCYNCGASGHYAQDCKQPSIEASQQGGFRLKYAPPHPETLDSAD
ncbi:zinc finger CCHC domain-containing protein 2-like isoform X1 [Acipenser oxyrinchus oxyrinchus]|uniref:Zinc finger CCHC domain-containing protein 2-like isoform X1 n=1 Tax=Acipenser oxyrinchus oxyrinchus TaxID=40147 RepID=A0AAD8GGB4_ACIOX|nr:zinc finger CCHC domain-containing protein 2-like isoform X1 [Acipenser oxyrinchus oxyrinchus]